MFDELPECGSAADLEDAAVVDAIAGWTRAAATVAAQRLAFIAELTARRYDENWDIFEDACDAWDSAAAEISAACGISQGRAGADMDLGTALRARLPKVAALLKAGQISEYLTRHIVKRTALVQDPDLLAQLDAAIAERAATWGALSQKKLDTAIDLWVNRFDPGALRHTRRQARDRNIGFTDSDGGTTEIYGRLLGADAALLDRRLTLMAHDVCAEDPRTLKQRRADALGALGAGDAHLACLCGNPHCPAAAADDGRATNVVIHLYAEEAALSAAPDPLINGDDRTPAQTAQTQTAPTAAAAQPTNAPTAAAAEPTDTAGAASNTETAAVAGAPSSTETAEPPAAPCATPAPRASARPPAAVLPGFGIVPAPLLAALIAAGAKVRRVQSPAIDPENTYRISTALAEFVRARDLTCRFPNCDRPADFADLDHTTPYPAGPTHASNLKGYCRLHHLVKTFRHGWSDTQLPDGTVIITSPTGHTYTTKPGSSLYFPTINTTSAPLTPRPPHPGRRTDKTTKIPKRKRSRAKERAYRIAAERKLNDAHVAQCNAPPF